MVWKFKVPAGTFSDPDGDPLTVSAKMKNGADLPAWLSFDPSVAPYGEFTGMPENAGVFNGVYEISVTATDGVAQAVASFSLGIADESGTPIFVPIYDVQPKVTIYDAIAPAGPGVARVMIALDKPARESVCWKVTTQNGANNGNSGSTYTAKVQYVTFHAGEQYKFFDVQILVAMPTNRRINITTSGVGSNAGNTLLRNLGYIMTQAEADALVAAGTPPMLPGIAASPTTILPAAPKSGAGWTKVFDPDLTGSGFEATNTGYSASDGVTPCWFTRPGSSSNPMLGREQTGNSEDGIYGDNNVPAFAGTTPFPLVDTGGGVLKRALRAEYLDGLNGKPGPIPSPTIAKTYSYTAAMLTTRRNFNTIQPGDYVEVRAKMNPVLHTWPAIWLLPSNPFTWPPEIDLMEGFFSTLSADRIWSTVHWSSANKAYGSYFGYSEVLGVPFDPAGWNTWGCWIGLKWIVFYLNDVPYFMIPNMPMSVHGPQTWYLLLNIAVGGVGSGVPNNPEAFPVDFLLDYARVWRKTA